MVVLSRSLFVLLSSRLRKVCKKFFGGGPSAAKLVLAPLMQTDAAVQAGTLLRGQPYLSELAWERGHRRWPSGLQLGWNDPYIGSPKVRELIGEVLVAPVQPWDALICTSPAVRECLEGFLDRAQAYLSQRFGSSLSTRPQLPLLPLGVDQSDLLEQRADQRSREFLRRYLRLGESDVLVLWLGRLSFFEGLPPGHVYCSSESGATLWTSPPFRYGGLVSRRRG